MKIVYGLLFAFLVLCPILFAANAVEVVDEDEEPTLTPDFKQEKTGSKTHDNTVAREEEEISDEGFSIAEKRLLTENKFQFQAEINRLMGILINSLYSNRDIFLREVISNASDALDKLRFMSLTDKSVLGEGEGARLEIRIRVDKKNKMLHVRDTGIGMTKEDLVNNLGRIAKSGTADFIEKLSQSDTMTSQIGQFGVGFYSTFLAAHTVTVTTKHNDDASQYVWESTDNDQGSYTIAEDPRGNTLGRGTLVSMHLKPDAEEYLEEAKLKDLIRKYSEFINFPIYLWCSHERDTFDDVTEEEAAVSEEELKEAAAVEGDEPVSEDEAQKMFKETVWDWELVNENKPIWTRKPESISEEEYKKFYQVLVKDESEPLTRIHFTAEGDHSFTGLLYVPGTPPHAMFDQRASMSQLKLYVKRVFITDRIDMLPKYLAFLAGIVDSDDLPLNISRESLQQHKIMDIIRKKLVRKALAMFQELAQDNPEEYNKFYAKYHTNLKLGAIEDFTNRPRITKLLRFTTYNHPEKQISLEEYVTEMREGQDKIYFLGGESDSIIRSSPLLETLTSKGYDILFLTAPIDEYLIETVNKFEVKSHKYKFADVGKEGIKVDADEEKAIKELRETFEPLTDFLKKHIEGKFYSVKLTTRLRNTPCALVAAANSYSANMERIIKAQALGGDERLKNVAPVNKVLELNPHHPIVAELLRLVNDGQEDRAKEAGQLLFDSAVVSSGFSLEEPLAFSHRLYKALSQNLNVDMTEFEKNTAKPLVYNPEQEKNNDNDDDDDDHMEHLNNNKDNDNKDEL